MSVLYKVECFFKRKEDGIYLKSLNLGSLLIIVVLITLLGLGTMVVEQILPKKYINQGRRIKMTVFIQKGHHLFYKIYNYNLTIIVPIYIYFLVSLI